jgi:hypothetical protein
MCKEGGQLFNRNSSSSRVQVVYALPSGVWLRLASSGWWGYLLAVMLVTNQDAALSLFLGTKGTKSLVGWAIAAIVIHCQCSKYTSRCRISL